MHHAYARGDVEPLSPVITEFVRYLGHWWTIDPPEWIRVVDTEFAAWLDDEHQRLADVLNLDDLRRRARADRQRPGEWQNTT
ncbi:MAG: hypothetical protein ACRDXX_17395 [Stackebrandtia sp.]